MELGLVIPLLDLVCIGWWFTVVGCGRAVAGGYDWDGANSGRESEEVGWDIGLEGVSERVRQDWDETGAGKAPRSEGWLREWRYN